MPVNPLQRKSRNSFLLGMFIMLLISGTIIAFMTYKFIILPSKQEQERGDEKIVYVLSQDVESGKIITSNLLTPLTVFANMVPENYAGPIVIDTLELKDNNGNFVYTNKDGKLYIEGPSKQEIIIEEDLDGTYYKIENSERVYIELINVPVIAKVDLKANTILTKSVIVNSDEKCANDIRLQEYNMITIPTTLDIDDYVDIRLMLPTGQDFIVLSKKRIIDVTDETIKMNLSEKEILSMGSAIIDSYVMVGSNLYATKYIEPGMQESATPTYVARKETLKLVQDNPNISPEDLNKYMNLFNKDVNLDGALYKYSELYRMYINNAITPYSENYLSNIESGIQNQIEKAKEAREKYLSGVQ